MEKCTCNPETFPFHCLRHQCLKSRHFWVVCQSNPYYDPRHDDVWREEFGTNSAGPPAPAIAPPVLEQLWNLGSALKAFIADGLCTVSPEEYAARLEICESCDQ